MHIRKLFIGLTLLLSAPLLHAQMTDSQLVNTAKQRLESGADVTTVGAELVANGATADQITRLSSGAANATTTGQTARTDVDRSRKNNGEKGLDINPERIPASIPERIIFGHDIFRSQNLNFEPNMSIAIAPSYVLGPGDELIIDVYGASQSTSKIKIAPDGSVTIPRIGPVQVGGMTVEKAQAKIRSTMGSHYQDAAIKVDVGQTRTISVNVMGEVLIPGSYQLSAFATVFHALYMAGGVNEIGTLRDVKVVRNGKIISTIDVYEYILNGRLAGDVKLSDNDVIIVGSYQNLVNISGNVKRPMWYEMKNSETLESLMKFSGGFSGEAHTKDLTVKRSLGDKLSLYTVGEADFGSFMLADMDSVIVKTNEQRYSNAVKVNGAVKRPGQYELTAANSVLGLIKLAGGLEENAMTSRAVLIRMNENRTHKTIAVALEDMLNGKAKDIKLENEDELTIATLADLHEDRNMTIEGEVWKPGVYEYSENTSIEDLITMAGGLKESASYLNVEVARRIINPNAAVDSIAKSETFNFTLNENLKSTGHENFTLKPYDRVYIRRSPVFVAQKTVSVSGEVVFAGNYTLKSTNEKLTDIISAAGGLKKNAYPKNARLVRKMNLTEKERESQLAELSENLSDSLDVDKGKTTYSVAIDLEKALAAPGSKYDIILRDGDEIIVPSMLNTVTISGEVLYPNNVTYIEGMSAKYYINEAGGYTKRSLRSRTYVIYANGHVSRLSRGHIEPGCEIVVPFKEKKNFSDDFGRWATIGSSMATVAAVVLTAINTMSKD